MSLRLRIWLCTAASTAVLAALLAAAAWDDTGVAWSSGLVRTLTFWAIAWVCLSALAWWWIGRVLAPVAALGAQVARWRPQSAPLQTCLPELSPLADALNDLSRRQESWLREQATQHGAMRQEASTDSLTGLANRRQFLSDLTSQLSRPGSPAHGVLVLVRMLDLDTANQRVGRERVDQVLQDVARALDGHVRAAGSGSGVGGFAGRLNGPDFGACFAGADAVAHLGDGVLAAVEAVLSVDTARGQAQDAPFPRGVAVGSTGYTFGDQLGTVLAVADEALAQAEHRPGQHVAVVDVDRDASPLGGEGQWRRQLVAALDHGDLEMTQSPVMDRQGGLVHLACHLRLALQPGTEKAGAERWLPLALRTGTVDQIDLAAVEQALTWIGVGGRRCSVELQLDSVLMPGFVARLEALLRRYPESAAHLCLELPERALRHSGDLLRALGQQVCAAGAGWGICHAGLDVQVLTRLGSLPLDYLKLDASVTAGIEDDPAVRQLVRNLVATAHGLGVLVHAEGPLTEAQAQALWACGVDGCGTTTALS